MTRDRDIQILVDRWVREYVDRTGRELYEIQDRGFTYVYDVEAGRAVCVSGRSSRPTSKRDAARQAGSPPPGDQTHRGHLIAHSMGGGMDINLFRQDAKLNVGRDWRAIERYAAEHPGTAVAVHLRYEDDSDRPTTIDYAHEDAERGLVVDRFDNRPPTPPRRESPGRRRPLREADGRPRER